MKPDVRVMPVKGRQTDEGVSPRHTVLIVEADTCLRDTYWSQLIEAGYRGVAANGKNVLDVLYAENVSVILLDLFAPDMDGMEILRSVKRVSPDTLVIAVSEDSAPLDRLAVATELGADAFIRKPAAAQAIIEAVTALTSRGNGTSPAERRRYTRLSLDQRGFLYNPPHDLPLECRVVNLSAGGALIQTGSKCPADRPLILHVDGFGSFEGIVVHSTEELTGFRFLMGELKRDRLKQALASFAKHGVAPIGTYGIHPNFKAAGAG